MANLYKYEFKKFKSGKRKGETYVNIRSVKTGKTIRTVSSKVKVASAIKSAKQQDYRKDEKELDDMIRKAAKEYDGDYKQLKKLYKAKIAGEIKKEAERMKKGKKEGKLMRGRKVKNIKKDIIEKTVQKKAGCVTTWRLYWVVTENKYSSPYIAARGAGQMHGDRYTKAIKLVNKHSLPIIEEHKSRKGARILTGSGSGACVRLIERSTGRTIDAYELGAGCRR